MKNLELAFISQGFNNWKKACEKFEALESSEAHKEAILEPNSFALLGLMLNLIIKSSIAERSVYKRTFLPPMLLRQGLPIRGHTEQEGNLMQSLCLRSNDDPRIKHPRIRN